MKRYNKKSRRFAVVLVLLIAVGFVLLAAGRGGVPAGVGTATVGGHFGGYGSGAVTAPAGDPPDSDVRLAPDFTLERLDGTALTLSSYYGEKPVILDFFATWCPNCRRDIPKESVLYTKYRDKVEVIGVNLQENPATVRSFVAEHNVPFPVVLDPRGEASNLYAVRYTNFHVLIGKNGEVLRVVPGDIREADFEELASS